jgi:hypothetical protein
MKHTLTIVEVNDMRKMCLHLTVKLLAENISLKFKGGEQQHALCFVCMWTYVLEFGQVALRNIQSFCNLKREKSSYKRFEAVVISSFNPISSIVS